ncbi:MAG: MTH1187 family thiamine-binding protein [Candidatus Aminicenantales bacterium]
MIIEFSIVPIGRGETLAGPVARILDLVDKSGLPYQLTAMGTIIEGEWDEVFRLVRRCHEAMQGETGRVYTHITIDDRPGTSGRIAGKVREVEESLGRSLKK